MEVCGALKSTKCIKYNDVSSLISMRGDNKCKHFAASGLNSLYYLDSDVAANWIDLIATEKQLLHTA